jgi:hypothetical protein
MKRALALGAVALALGAGLAGCRNAPEARQPQQPAPAAVQTTPKPAPQNGTATGSSAQVTGADVSSELSDVDKMLQEMDGQLAKADASPADGD